MRATRWRNNTDGATAIETAILAAAIALVIFMVASAVGGRVSERLEQAFDALRGGEAHQGGAAPSEETTPRR